MGTVMLRQRSELYVLRS